MEDKTRVAFKYHLVLDVVLSTLRFEDINWRWPTGYTKPLTPKDGLRADDSIWDHGHGYQHLAWTITIYHTFSPFGLKIIGSPVVLQSLRRIVVLPALARPIMRIRNWVNFVRIFWIWSTVNWGFDEVDIAQDTMCERSKLSCTMYVTLTNTAHKQSRLQTHAHAHLGLRFHDTSPRNLLPLCK